MKRRALAMVVAIAIAGGACGGDDDGDITDSTAATSDEPADSAAATSDEPADVAATTSDEPADADEIADDSGVGEWCDLADEFSAATLDDVDRGDPDAVQKRVEEFLGLLDDTTDAAPDEIEDDATIVADAIHQLVEQLKEVDYDFEAVDQTLLDDPSVNAADDRLEEYRDRVCGNGSDVVVDDTGG